MKKERKYFDEFEMGLLEKYGIKNNVYKEDYDFIIKVYHKCQEEGSFLKEGD